MEEPSAAGETPLAQTDSPRTQGRMPGQEWDFAGQPVRVLFVCADNGTCSQLAQALTQKLSAGQVEASSAGITPAQTLHPETIRILRRLGANLAAHTPTPLDQSRIDSFDRIVLISDQYHEELSAVPNVPNLVIWNIADPTTTTEASIPLSQRFEHLTIELTTRVRILLTLLARQKRESF